MKIRQFLVICGLFVSFLAHGGLEKSAAREVLISLGTIATSADILKLAENIHKQLEDRKLMFDSSADTTVFEASNINLELEDSELQDLHDQLTWFDHYLSVEDRYLNDYYSHIMCAQNQLALSGVGAVGGVMFGVVAGVLQTIQLACYQERCEQGFAMVYTSSGELCFENGIAYQCANYLSQILRMTQLPYFFYRDDCAANIPSDLIGTPIAYEKPIAHWSEKCSAMVGGIPFIPSALLFAGSALTGVGGVCSIAQAKWAKDELTDCSNTDEIKDCSEIIKKLDGMPEELKKVLNNANGFYLLNTGKLETCDFVQDEVYGRAQECQGKSWWGIIKQVFSRSN